MLNPRCSRPVSAAPFLSARALRPMSRACESSQSQRLVRCFRNSDRSLAPSVQVQLGRRVVQPEVS